MGKLLKDMTNDEILDLRLDSMGFDENEKRIIFASINFRKVTTFWIMTAPRKEINDWYDSLAI
ncbi:MAG: hypothetical protein WC554_17115 [Clostridia bacterium]|jgi:hypothetical protein